MKRLPYKIISFVFAALFILSAPFSVSAAPALPEKNDEAPHVIATFLSEEATEYYSGEYSYASLSALPGAADASDSYAAMQNNPLFDALRALMTGTEKYNTRYSGTGAGSLAYYWQSTDSAKGEESYVYFYSGKTSSDTSLVLNREHIWPKSRASFSESGGGSDLHHLRPSVDFINRAKSNHTFGDVRGVFYDGYRTGEIGGEAVYFLNSGADLFECRDDIKGDVARILLYIYCRYGQPNLYSDVDGEIIKTLFGEDAEDSGVRVIEDLATLLEWCEDDPVDTRELKRNDLAGQVKGNRNVFIDYPEFAWLLFGLPVPPSLLSPTDTVGHLHDFNPADEPPFDCERDISYTAECTRCGIKREKIKKAAGHRDKDADGRCDLCGKRQPAADKIFTDLIPGSWYIDAVNFTYDKEIFAGVSETLFAPNEKTSRAMMACLFYRLAGENEAGGAGQPFADVPAGRWYTPGIAWAAENGIAAGIGSGRFAPDEAITREQAAVMLCNFADYINKKLEKSADISGFADSDLISDWAKDAVARSVGSGIMVGDGRGLAPSRAISRAESANLLMRFICSVY